MGKRSRATAAKRKRSQSTQRTRRRFRSSVTWLTTVALAALAAVLTTAATGGFSVLWNRLSRLANDRPPVVIDTTQDIATFRPVLGVQPVYVFDKPLDQLSPPPPEGRPYGDRDAWSSALGGVRGGQMEVQVAVSARPPNPVILTNLAINVTDRRPPIGGTAITYGPTGDAFPERILTVELDAIPPRITGSVDLRNPQDPNFQGDPINFPYKIEPGETEIFHLVVSTDSCHCKWNATLSYLSGKRGSIVIDDNGKPFELTSTSRSSFFSSVDGKTFQPKAAPVDLRSVPSTPTSSSPSSASPAAASGQPTCWQDLIGDNQLGVSPRAYPPADIRRVCVRYQDTTITVAIETDKFESPLRNDLWKPDSRGLSASKGFVRFDNNNDDYTEYVVDWFRQGDSMAIQVREYYQTGASVVCDEPVPSIMTDRLIIVIPSRCVKSANPIRLRVSLLIQGATERGSDDAPDSSDHAPYTANMVEVYREAS